MNDALSQAVRQTLAALPPGARVVCALSGGADSVAMTHCVMTLGSALGLRVEAAHYNHQLRGAESDRDEAFVRDLCAQWALPLTVERGTVRSTGTGTEDAARQLRYDFLRRVAGEDWLATAHTMDDQAETILLQLLRGAGLRGLGGMPPERNRLLRPLLSARRVDTLAYLARHELPHVEDSSNAADDYRRNRVRHRLLPLLAQENPRIIPALSEMGARLRQEEDLLSELTAQAVAQARDGDTLRCAAVSALHPALQARVLRAFVPTELSARHTQALLQLVQSGAGSGAVSLPGGWIARRAYDSLQLVRDAAPQWTPRTLTIPGYCRIAETGWLVSCAYAEFAAETSQNSYTFYLARDTIACKLILRTRQPGDWLRLPGGSRTLKRLMIDRKIPAWHRDTLPVLADEQGVLAVPGLGAHLERLAKPGTPALRVIFAVQQERDGGTYDVP